LENGPPYGKIKNIQIASGGGAVNILPEKEVANVRTA
jgi:hypothetical protein